MTTTTICEDCELEACECHIECDDCDQYMKDCECGNGHAIAGKYDFSGRDL